MAARTLMIQGTASHVGKSVLVTALCDPSRSGAVLERLFDEDGEPIQPQVIAAVSSDHLLCLEELEP